MTYQIETPQDTWWEGIEEDLLNEIHDIIEEGDNGTPPDIVEVMFNLLDVNQLTQLEDIIVNQYGESND